MKKNLAVPLVVLLATLALAYACNFWSLQSPMNDVLKSDPRNSGIAVSVRYSRYILPSTVVFDLTEVGATNSPVDVFRVFLQFADEMKASS